MSTAEELSFEKHIKPLFRESDRTAMLVAFDLWAYDDVKQHADRILSTVRAGTMPCDQRWSSEHVELFRRWADGPMGR